jgi:nucleotide-binding universal stress UspA family protein
MLAKEHPPPQETEPAVFSTVIVGYDGSAQALDALALGQDLCERHGGMLLPACAYPFEPRFDEEQAMGERSRGARLTAEEQLRDVRAQLPDRLMVETRAVPSTSVAHALTELAEEEAADLIVVGSTAHARDRRLGVGDVATRLLHGSPCAVAVAPPGYWIGLHHLGVAYDGSPESEQALDAAYRIATELHASVTIYSVVVTPRFGPGALPAGHRAEAIDDRIAQQARDRLTDAALRAPAPLLPDTRLLEGPPVEAISQAAADAVDLLVMGSRGYGPVRRAVLGSVSAGLVHAATVPVLVTPRGAAHRHTTGSARFAVSVA